MIIVVVIMDMRNSWFRSSKSHTAHHFHPLAPGRVTSCSVAQSCLTLCDAWTVACQASRSFAVSWSLPKLMFIESAMSPNHLILCSFSSCPQSFPVSGSFLMSQLLTPGGRSTGASASALEIQCRGLNAARGPGAGPFFPHQMEKCYN